ncbi:MAG: Eco57I restriction-modification methylase domain-containing protein [archaeon]
MPAANGYVPTPAPVADLLAATVFGAIRPSEVDGGGRILLPGLGTGNLYAGVRRYCTAGENWRVPEFDYPMPECVGVEQSASLIERFRDARPTDDVTITIHHADFLLDPPEGTFDWVLANPPYTRYRNIDEDRREVYRDRFQTATGQFPLYAPFTEQMLDLLKPGGDLTVILPTKVLNTDVTEPLREFLAQYRRGPIVLLPDPTFDRAVTTVAITVRKVRDSHEGWWLENVLPYGPRPLLERLDVDDVDAAAAAYMADLRTRRNRQLQRTRGTPAHDPSSNAGGTDHEQTDLGAWSA